MNRTSIYKSYKNLKDYKEDTGKLLKQQVFLSSYVTDNYKNIDKMLLFHGIGTGKTCTSITIAESIMKIDKNMKVLVILPARLKTNFIDELISETCILNEDYRYISKEDFKNFTNPNISSNEKDKIRLRFNKNISEKYDIISYERLRIKLLESSDYKKTINDITKNRVLIIDEVHNLITTKIKPDNFDKVLKEKTINKKSSFINALLLRLITKLADKTSKIFLLTATPVFDNYGQFIQLVLNLSPDSNPNKKDLGYLINQIKGKVSFYKIKDRSEFPTVETINHTVLLSQKQINSIYLNKKNSSNDDNKDYEDNHQDDDEDISDKFCLNERQLSISLLDKYHKNKIFKNLQEYAPKLKLLFEIINNQKGKHVVYSNFIQYCLELIAEYLKTNGWNNYIENGSKKYKTFIIWDGRLKDKEKQEVKSILNLKENMDGEIIRLVLGSPSIKEGISFKHIQHLHQIDPVWNSSAKEQIEGRCIRFKSHDDIPLNHKFLKKKVIIHNYIASYGNEINQTCDENIYYNIITRKQHIISVIEKLLSKVSIDYYLWTNTDKIPQSHTSSSDISVLSAERKIKHIKININAKSTDKNLSSCPKKRRPRKGICKDPLYQYLRKNKKGIDCCYSKNISVNINTNDKSNIKNTCPVPRRLINGECKNPKYPFIGLNKQGIQCCYIKKQK